MRSSVVVELEKFAVEDTVPLPPQNSDAFGPERGITSLDTMAPLNGPTSITRGFATSIGGLNRSVTLIVFGALKNGLLCPTRFVLNHGFQIVDEEEPERHSVKQLDPTLHRQTHATPSACNKQGN